MSTSISAGRVGEDARRERSHGEPLAVVRRDDVGLASLLASAASGDKAAFARFYDATCGRVHALELRRARARGLDDLAVRRHAEHETRRRYVTAWRYAARYPASCLSPLAWLLSLDLPAGDPTDAPPEDACCA